MYPGIELLGHMVVLSSVFWETSILLFTLDVQIYISTFLHILSDIYFSPFLIVAIWSGVKWYLIEFPWLLVVLSIFSSASWPSPFLLGKISFQFFFLFFKLGCLFFDVELHDTYICIYIYMILIPYWSHHVQIYSPHSLGCIFILLMVSFALKKLLSLIRSHLFIFAYVFFTLGEGSKKYSINKPRNKPKEKKKFKETQIWFFEKISKTDKFLVKLIKKKKEKA